MDRLATTVFDTRNLPLQDRFTAWRSSIGVIFDPSLDDRFDPLKFNARVDAAMFGQVFVGRLISSTQTFARPQSKILADGLDAYLVQVFKAGTCEVQDGRHTRIVRPGDIYIIDASAPLEAIDYGFDHITTIIPRDMIDRNLVSPDGHHRRIVPAELPLAKLLYSYICGLSANRMDMTVSDGLAAIAPLLNLTEGVLNMKVPGAAGQQDPQAVEFALLNTVKDHIEANLGQRGLTPDAVAAAMGMSRSRLYRLFEPVGGVSRYIKQRQLRRSLRDLLDRSHQHMRIGEIAWRWGFGSESDYSRAFKQRYGVSPSDARVAHSRAIAIARNRDGTGSYENWIAEIGTWNDVDETSQALQGAFALLVGATDSHQCQLSIDQAFFVATLIQKPRNVWKSNDRWLKYPSRTGWRFSQSVNRLIFETRQPEQSVNQLGCIVKGTPPEHDEFLASFGGGPDANPEENVKEETDGTRPTDPSRYIYPDS